MTAARSDTLVSILSPVYNESLYIEEMIASVLGQTHSNLELILVDDGSSDDTVAKVQAVAAKDARVRVIDEGKRGKVGAFNRAYSEAQGDVIMLMGGDDVMPPDSVAVRLAAVESMLAEGTERVAAFARLITFSDNPKFSGQVIPRSAARGARSGGTLALSRTLAELAFPVPQELVAEDLWVGGVAGDLADAIVDIPDIVLNYRIHPGNSNPRNQPFAKMTHSMHARFRAYELLANDEKLPFTDEQRQAYRAKVALEEQRFSGSVVGVLTASGSSLTDRLRALSMTSAFLFGVRRSMFKLFSGWT